MSSSKRLWDHQDRNCVTNKKMRFLVVAGEDFRSQLRVPLEFESYLRKIISDTIKLNAPNGCVYDIRITRELGETVLRSGWDVFATSHNLEQNDYLVFKFYGNSTFKVQIYSSCDGCQKITSCVYPPPGTFEAVPNGGGISYAGHVQTLAGCGYSTSVGSQLSKAQDGCQKITSCVNPPPGGGMSYAGHVQTLAGSDYLTSVGSRLSKVQDKKVLEIAQTIKSEIPLYVAVMNKSNVDLNSCFIRIPSILMKDVREKVHILTVKLEAPDANVYSVSAIPEGNDDIVLESGWEAFVVAHHIEERDLIIFIHKGNSRLKVFILDPNGCQKTSSCFGIGYISNTQEMLDDSVEIFNPPHKADDIIDLSSNSDDENNVAAYSAKSNNGHKGSFAKTRTSASISCPSIKHSHLPTSEGPSQPPYIKSKMASLSRVLENMVRGKVQAIGSEIPIHVSVMGKTNIGEGGFLLQFTKAYARRYLPSTNQDLILELEGCQGKQWHTVLYVHGGNRRSRGARRIVRGWADFVCGNHLKLGDICLFELVKDSTNLRMKVHLIRNAGADI